MSLPGKLISISEEHEFDPNTGTTSEVTFNVDKFSINTIPKEMIVGKLNESIFIFDQKSIYKIIDDQGSILFANDKNLKVAKALLIERSERLEKSDEKNKMK